MTASSNSNATARTRADFLSDLGAVINTIASDAGHMQRPIDRAYVTKIANGLDVICAAWREYAPRTCESVDCDTIVTDPLDALCPSCQSGGTPTRRDVLRRDSDDGRVIEAPPRESIIASAFRTQRMHALAKRICHILVDTLQVRPRENDTDDARVDFTDASLRVLAPLIEAIDILEAIVWASDGCVGHRDCAHSIEPWKRARALLAPKWRADTEPGATWPDPNFAKGQV